MSLSKHITPEDETLVSAVKQDDPDAFKELYFKYYKMLFSFAYYHLHSTDKVKEFLQELFVHIWEKRELLDPQKPVKAYLFKSLNNLIINSAALHSSKNISLEKIKGKSISSSDQDMKIDIETALVTMPVKLKTVFLLSRNEGFKYYEIAEICRISVKAVEKRMAGAFDHLKKFLDKK